MKLPSIIVLTGSMAMSGCLMTPEQQSNNEALRNKAASVRFISPAATKRCKYVSQTSLTQDGSFFGQETTEQLARNKLMLRAASIGANGIRITDRVLDKGRGGYDKTRMSFYADFYRC